MNRRQFLNIGCTAALGTMAGRLSAFVPPYGEATNNNIFVLIFLRGGCDALQLVAPVSDKNYIDVRDAQLRIAESGPQRGLRLGNTLNNLDFCLNHKANIFKELYDSKKLAIIHSVGLPNGTRSHFEAMDLIEKGMVDDKTSFNTEGGWLARLTASLSDQEAYPAIATGGVLPASFLGSSKALSITKAKEYQLHNDARILGLLKNMYQNDALMGQTALKTIDTVRFLNKKLPKKGDEIMDYQPTVKYPEGDYASDLSENLKALAQMIKMDVGVQIATVDFIGWDTHENQNYHFPILVDALDKAVGAFYNDLNAYHDRLNILIMSEFGRRLKSNKSNGTDHGYGGVMLSIGNTVKGGKMYGQWKGLATEQLDNRVDLAVTTDYRTVLSETISKQLNIKQLDKIFPQFKDYKPLGFMG